MSCVPSTSEVYRNGAVCADRRKASIARPVTLFFQQVRSVLIEMAESFHLSFDVPLVTIRPFNTFGPRRSARAVIPTIITQCLTGSVVRLGNLRPTRDLNYVTDTADGFVKAAETQEAIGLTINLGSSKEINIGDLATLIARLCDREIAIESEEQRERPDNSEVERLLADNTLARTILGWQPATSLEEGLKLTIAWLRRRI